MNAIENATKVLELKNKTDVIAKATKVLEFKKKIDAIFFLMGSKRKPTDNDINWYIEDYGGCECVEGFVLDFMEGEGCFRSKALRGIDYDITTFDGTELEYIHLLDTCRFLNIKDGDIEKWATADGYKVIPKDELPKHFDKAFRNFLGISKDGSYADVLWLDTPHNRIRLQTFELMYA